MLLTLLLATAGCGTAPPSIPAAPLIALDTAPPDEPARDPPPASSPAKPYRSPAVTWAELPNGVRVATVPRKGLPVAQIRVVVGAGRANDGERPGLAGLTADLLREGGAGSMSSRELVTRVAAMGAELSIETGFDATKLGLAVTSDRLGEAIDLLGAIVQRPRLEVGEFDKLKHREADKLADAARSRGAWGASMVLFKDLFSLPSEQHPYAAWSATASELLRISATDCRAFHKSLYVGSNTALIVAGDVTAEAVRAFAEKAFGRAPRGEAPVVSFTDPWPPEHRKITLVDRPGSSQSDVFVGSLGPNRGDKGFPAFAVANQILGGGVAGRLFADVRERRSLAYSTRSTITELAHGPSVLIAHAGTQTAKTGLALAALLEQLEALGKTVADEAEVGVAERYLVDGFAVHLETPGAIADEVARLHTLGLPDDADTTYRRELADVTPPLALKAASDNLRAGHEIIVVSGDAAVIGPMLAPFGEVKVVDATRDFARLRTLPRVLPRMEETPAAER